MAAIEADVALAPLLELSEADVPEALALSDEAGWNQTAEDWSLMIRLGRAFGVRIPDGRLVATALALPYPPPFGWVSMVLVHEPFRRRGIATRLLERAIAELRNRGLVAILDATPAGRPVYERIGFRPIDALTRWRGHGGGGRPDAALAPIESDAAGDLAELDRAAFGADRWAVIADILGRPGARSFRDAQGHGFVCVRPGRRATHIGPLVARETDAALALLGAGLAAAEGPVKIDVLDRETELAELLSGRGFEAERPFTRMALDRDTGFGDPALVRVAAGPELG